MRTTVSLDDDVLAAVERLRRDEGIGFSQAVNRLARAGLSVDASRRQAFRQRTAELGLSVSVDDVAGVLEVLDESPR